MVLVLAALRVDTRTALFCNGLPYSVDRYRMCSSSLKVPLFLPRPPCHHILLVSWQSSLASQVATRSPLVGSGGFVGLRLLQAGRMAASPGFEAVPASRHYVAMPLLL